MKKNQYALSPDAADYLREALQDAVEHKDRNFGNARFVRNIFEKAIQMQANRLSGRQNLTKAELSELTAEDIRHAFGK